MLCSFLLHASRLRRDKLQKRTKRKSSLGFRRPTYGSIPKPDKPFVPLYPPRPSVFPSLLVGRGFEGWVCRAETFLCQLSLDGCQRKLGKEEFLNKSKNQVRISVMTQ